MTDKVIPLQIKPGIQRDGTLFASQRYVDGEWVRFQRGLPRKIGGYAGAFLNANLSRGMIMSASNGTNYVVSGYAGGVEEWLTLTTGASGSGSTQFTMPSSSYWAASANNTWQFDIGFDSTGGGSNQLVAHPSQNLADISSTINTRPLFSQFTTTTLAPVGVFTVPAGIVNGSNTMTLVSSYAAVGAGLTVAGTGIQSGTTILSVLGTVVYLSIPATSGANALVLANVAVTGTAGQCSCTASTIVVGQVVSVTGTDTGTETGIGIGTYYVIATNGTTTFQLSLSSGGSGLSTTTGTTTGATFTVYTPANLTLDNNISVSGGVCMLYPYLFVYGNNGLIQNCAAGDFNNWTSADSNTNNVASSKIIKGLPVRGGTTSPSGLFWSLDSLIRVSYTPTVVTTGTQSLTYYWRYDLISQQSSILSSNSVIEYDGIYFWCGTDRFLMYNGVMKEIPNDTNLNYFFDNLNYNARQKVWACKVPRWGEIWWFYPKGNATECTDAIIYNVREDIWYDAGQALGAQRSAGTFSEVFRFPVWAGNSPNTLGTYTLWQHETGTDQIYLTNVAAIYSAFETPPLGALGGLVGTPNIGNNSWAWLERVEPDFIQAGNMDMIVTGRGYADDTDQISAPYVFTSSTLKIDLREQRREMRLRFESNIQGGNYQVGKILLSIDIGDTRSTGNP